MPRTTLRLVTVSAALLAVHCASEEPSSSSSSAAVASDGLPCDVQKVIADRCQRCHGETPKFGAPMKLVSWTDVHDKAQVVGQRIHDPRSPMPPGAPLPDAERAVLDDWIAKGAPRSEATCNAAAAAGVATSGPDALPCPPDQRVSLRAHGTGADARFAMPSDATNLQQCFSWKVPWKGARQATAYAPVIDDARALHHWILFETATPQEDGGTHPCEMPSDARFLMGWAPGGDGAVMPKDVGLELPGEDRWLILQVHYWNAAHLTDVRDASGVAMCVTKENEPRPITAVVSTLGSLAIDLPPRSSDVQVTSHCRPRLTEPVDIMGAGPHMHRLGRRLTTDVLRGGREDDVVNVVDVKAWDFENQQGYPADVVVNPGDVVRTTCTYTNDTDRRVRFGERTEDEMCFDFVTVWPAPGLAAEGSEATRRCFGK